MQLETLKGPEMFKRLAAAPAVAWNSSGPGLRVVLPMKNVTVLSRVHYLE